MKLYLNPIYTSKNKSPKRKKWIRVFIVVIIIHLIGFDYYKNFKKNKNYVTDSTHTQKHKFYQKRK